MKVVIGLIFLPSVIFCQSEILLESSTGVATGWWVYNKGSSEPSLTNTLGWDRTQHAVFLPFELSLLYKLHRFKLGIGVNYSLFLADKMRAFEDSDFRFLRYKISAGSVKFTKYSLQAEVDLIKIGYFSLAPNVRFGVFKIDTVHPERQNFGRQTFWEVGVTNELRFARFAFVLRPQYNAMIIVPEQAKNKNEKHAIYNFGLILGLRFWLKQ